MRILFISYCPPLPSWGGAMTFYRHFIERDDFKTLVITDNRDVENYELAYKPILISKPKFWDRISRTRFLPIVYGVECLIGDKLFPNEVLDKCKEFQPDAVFTVAGSWDWTTLAAQKVAEILDVPLIASFNDWFDYGWFPAHKLFHKSIERRYRKFYSQAHLAVTTSEGMRDELGAHKNVHLLYPTGAKMEESLETYVPIKHDTINPMTIFFGGSLGDWYGKMLEALVTKCSEVLPEVKFKIFGAQESWSQEFHKWAIDNQVFMGRVSFEELKNEAKEADLLILPMGFDPKVAIVERTSFKTKFLDYLTFRRPILVWGPEYCSAVKTAKEFDSGECVISLEVESCIESLRQLVNQPQRRLELIDNAQNMYDNRFHPEKIHLGLVEKVNELIGRNTNK